MPHPLEAKIRRVSRDFSALGDKRAFAELIRIIRRPGWTTPAEVAFAGGLLDTLGAAARSLALGRQTLLQGARKVGLEK
jgi:hypothetical protein